MKRILLTLALAGIMTVGATGTASAITKHAGKVQTNKYAEIQCNKDDKCKRYGAAFCHATREGVGCYAYNFEQSRRVGKYTCRRYIEWFDATHYDAAEWKCKWEGWDFY